MIFMRHLLLLFAATTAAAVFSPALLAQQLQTVQGADAEELLAPPLPPSLVPPLPIEPTQPQPAPLYGPMIIQRSDSHQKAIVYQKVSHHPSYRVTYHDHRRLRRPCCPLTKLTIAIPDPLRPGCVAEICVSAPACVKGHPAVAPSPGLLGRGVVTLCWSNGHRVKVVFKKLAPHLLVHSFPS